MSNNHEHNVRIGTSGYEYDHWAGNFYPQDIKKKEWFTYYSEIFNTVEINNTFYNLPSKKTFISWYEAAPENFLFVLKYSRYGSHRKHLKDPEQHLDRFLQHAKELKELLGPILLQLRPNWNANPERLENFLQTSPGHIQWAVEFRDKSWLCDEVYDILKENNAALVQHDMFNNHPEVITADWTYLRFHGPGDDKYEGSYSTEALTHIADKIEEYIKENIQVFVYFNNDQNGYAPQNAEELAGLVKERMQANHT